MLFFFPLVGCIPHSDINSYKVNAVDEPPTTEMLLPMFQARVAALIESPKFDVPSKWRKAANDEFSLAAFAAGPNERPVRITVTRTPAAMGADVQLNRWRTQLQLDPLPSDEIRQGGEEIEIDGQAARFVRFDGDAESIAGAVVQSGGHMWFFKMRGPRETVDEQIETMKAFCRKATIK
jgi:hypothetical protein